MRTFEGPELRTSPAARLFVVGLNVVLAVMVIVLMFNLADASTSAAAQEREGGILSDEAQSWMAAVDQQRAVLPDDIPSFDGLQVWMRASLSSRTPVASAIGATNTLYLPLTTNPPPTPQGLGTVSVLADPGTCSNPGDGDPCYELQVSCPQVSSERRVYIRVGDPPIGVSQQGTMIFAGGFDGTYYWGWGSGYLNVITQVQSAGYRTVELDWQTDWRTGETNQLEGLDNLSCGWATVAQWIHDNLHDPQQPYCALGHSNGATQVGYALTHYDMSQLFDAVIFEGGPNYVRHDHGCIQDTSDPVNQALYYPSDERAALNRSYGLSDSTSDPVACVASDESFRPIFEDSSLAFANWQYNTYPNTSISFIFGITDTTPTAVHGLYYYNRLNQAGTPLLSMQVITGTGHFVARTPQGADAIASTLINECIKR